MIYVIAEPEEGDYRLCKIGYALRDCRGRLSELQCGNARPLKLLAEFEGSDYDERRAHSHFADLRIRGEWFLLTAHMVHILGWKRVATLDAWMKEIGNPSATRYRNDVARGLALLVSCPGAEKPLAVVVEELRNELSHMRHALARSEESQRVERRDWLQAAVQARRIERAQWEQWLEAAPTARPARGRKLRAIQ